MDTIYALSSGVGKVAVAVVRMSGPGSAGALTSICGSAPIPRHATLRTLRRANGETIDRGLALWFPAPESYTGEDLAELQVHGGRAVVEAVFDELHALGLRLAEPGEFSRRAFANGKQDLAELEGVADLIAAETEMQRRQAVAQAGGRFSEQCEAWRTELVDLRAEIEARLDFADEGDVSQDLSLSFRQRLDSVRDSLLHGAQSAEAGERMREGFRVALLGRPNSGKSTLLNALAGREVAIVTAEAGTTRDVIEVFLDIGGYPVKLSDTAGIRESDSAAEHIGVSRARVEAREADLVVWLEAGDGPFTGEPLPIEVGGDVWRVRSKADLLASLGSDGLAISARTGAGLDALLKLIGEKCAAFFAGGSALVTRTRHREALAAAAEYLGETRGVSDEILADLLRSASEAVGRITGRTGVEDVLDRLFAEFCIGK